MGSYVPGTDREQLEMLQTIGLSSLDDLYVDVPEELKLKNGLNLPAGKSEIEVRRSTVSYTHLTLPTTLNV